MRALALLLALLFAPQVALANVAAFPETALRGDREISEIRARAFARQPAEARPENAHFYGESTSGIVDDPINHRDPTGRNVPERLPPAGPASATPTPETVYTPSGQVDYGKAARLGGVPYGPDAQFQLDKANFARALGRAEQLELPAVARTPATARPARLDPPGQVSFEFSYAPGRQESLNFTPKPAPPWEIKVPSAKYPESAAHIRDAQAQGHPLVLTIDRPGAPGRRSESLAGRPKVPGMDLDEYPPALFKEGGEGASVRPISPADNRGAGACIGNQCRHLPNGTPVRIIPE